MTPRAWSPTGASLSARPEHERSTGDGAPEAAPQTGERPDPFVVESGDPRIVAYFGSAWPMVAQFADLLRTQGEVRGLIGPRELPRLWTRHILNSSSLAPFLPGTGAVADVGSGAGLPGIVLATMRPDLAFHLIEPMQRRVTWLRETCEALGLENVIVRQARAEELRGALVADVVTARAVAPLDRLARWALPLVRPGGRLVVLKGRRAAEEVSGAAAVLRKLRATDPTIHVVDPLCLGEPTWVVEITIR